MQSYTSSNKLTRGKNQRVPQNLDNKKNWDFGMGLSIGQLTLPALINLFGRVGWQVGKTLLLIKSIASWGNSLG